MDKRGNHVDKIVVSAFSWCMSFWYQNGRRLEKNSTVSKERIASAFKKKRNDKISKWITEFNPQVLLEWLVYWKLLFRIKAKIKPFYLLSWGWS